jgi:nucleoside-diphosphate-sugar epimerase
LARYLVSGGAGFIGSHIAERLLGKGHEVRILDDFSTGSRETVAMLAGRFGETLEIIEADVARLEACRDAVAGVNFVIHHAALASVPRSLQDPLATNEANATGTLNLLLLAREAGVRRFVYAGSSSVYGASEELPKKESMTPDPLSPYALSKLMGEEYARIFHEQFGLETITLRYFNVFGPRQDPDSAYAAVLPSFVSCLLQGKRPVIYGDGLQSRDFTYVDNVVDANLTSCRADGVCGVYNVACGSRTTLMELLAAIQQILGTDVAPRHEPERAGDVRHSQADISRARRDLHYEPRVSLAAGLKPTVAYFRSYFGSAGNET